MSESTHRSTQRVFLILEMVAQETSGLSFTEIFSLSNIPKSSLSPLLSTLAEADYLYLDGDTKKYHIGKNLYYLGCSYLKSNSLYQLLAREIQILANSLQTTAYFNLFRQGETIYHIISDTYTSVKVVRTPRASLPAYATATGKALLSQFDFSQLEEMYPNDFTTITPHTVKNIAQLWKQLETFRKTGFFEEVEESTLFIRCTAVPLEVEGKMVAAISVAQHVLEHTPETQEKIREKLLATKKILELLIVNHLDQWSRFGE